MAQFAGSPSLGSATSTGLESFAGHDAHCVTAGTKAPTFVLPDADMEMFDLQAELSRRIVVLGFFARDRMPSSLRTTIAYSDIESEFSRVGAEVACVSLDECLNHADFRDEHGLAIRLLSDPEAEVCRQYGVLHLREVDGVTRTAVQRVTFIIGRDGVIHHVLDDAGSREHAATVLNLVKDLSRSINGNRQEHRRHA